MQHGKRAALYARYSTDLQSERSVEDQLALCEGFAIAQGFKVAGRYSDKARSGATTIGRDGLSRLLVDARAGQFDAVIVEALDRLSRDQEDLAGLHKRLTFIGIEIIAVHDGRADAIQVGIRGLVSSLFLTDLKHKVRRGMSGVIRDGRHAGGRAYGYRPTPGRPGVMMIMEDEAAVVRRIFAYYLAGRTPRQIAEALNADGVTPPRGAKWNASTINGNLGRGHGILMNPVYAGRLVWNRVRMVRDPDTGKRISRVNPESEWQTKDAPELAIIDAETWQAVQDRKTGRSGQYAHKTARVHRERKSILSGLLKCSHCGGGMSRHSNHKGVVRVRCSTYNESRACRNGRAYRLDRIEAAVITGVKEKIERPEALVRFLEEWQAERRMEGAHRARAEAELAAAKASLDRLSHNLIAGRITEEFFDREAPEVKRKIEELEARLAAAPPTKIVTIHPGALAAYRAGLRRLSEVMGRADPVEDRELVESFRALIDRVIVHDEPVDGYAVEIVGRMAALLGSDAEAFGGKMVAEGRLGLPPNVVWGRFLADFGHSHRASKLRGARR